jgi:hypothetical protein
LPDVGSVAPIAIVGRVKLAEFKTKASIARSS